MSPFRLPASLRNDYLACTVMEHGETLVKSWFSDGGKMVIGGKDGWWLRGKV